jgi:hypothetical protein
MEVRNDEAAAPKSAGCGLICSPRTTVLRCWQRCPGPGIFDKMRASSRPPDGWPASLLNCSHYTGITVTTQSHLRGRTSPLPRAVATSHQSERTRYNSGDPDRRRQPWPSRGRRRLAGRQGPGGHRLRGLRRQTRPGLSGRHRAGRAGSRPERRRHGRDPARWRSPSQCPNTGVFYPHRLSRRRPAPRTGLLAEPHPEQLGQLLHVLRAADQDACVRGIAQR